MPVGALLQDPASTHEVVLEQKETSIGSDSSQISRSDDITSDITEKVKIQKSDDANDDIEMRYRVRHDQNSIPDQVPKLKSKEYHISLYSNKHRNPFNKITLGKMILNRSVPQNFYRQLKCNYYVSVEGY